MVSPLPSLQRFASLDSQSASSDVKAAVVAVINDLRATIEKSHDTAKSRKAIADLLDFLNSLQVGSHPGRSELAQSISKNILPLLYSKKNAKPIMVDDYQHLQAENMLVGYLSNRLAETLSFVQGQHPSHPGYGKGRRKEAVPPFCFFAPVFASGLRYLISQLLMVQFRTQQIEKNIYEPMKRDYIDKGKNPESLFEDKHVYLDKTVCEIFAWATEIEETMNYRKAQNKESSPNKIPAKIQDYSKEESLILELLDKLKLHSEGNDYFLPRSAGFRLIDSLYRLDKRRFLKVFKELQNAVTHGEDHNYIVRQVDNLANDMESIDFDIIALSAYIIGEKECCLSYRVLQDTCIGSARSREGMLEARPLISAELGRQPIHLAKNVLNAAENIRGNIKEFEDLLDLFHTNIKDISKLRFDQEISSCVGIFRCSNITQPLAAWLGDDGGNEEEAFFRKQQVMSAANKLWVTP
ncbi:MAG: hypothetical protein V7776_11670 [Halopseudomonas aestusnigri]